MNKERRKSVEKAAARVTDTIALLEEVQSDEQDAFDNMSEGVQESERGEESEAALDNIQEALDSLATAEGALDLVSEA